MRDYLYIWNDPDEKFILASGLQFSDLSKAMVAPGGFLLIEHQSDVASYDANSGFSFIPHSESSALLAENIYSWGNFVWADYASVTPPKIDQTEVAELLYFSHKSEPLSNASLPSLGNRFLAYIHDDGWYLKLYYREWSEMAATLKDFVPFEVLTALAAGEKAFWVKGNTVQAEEKTFDVDKIINSRL